MAGGGVLGIALMGYVYVLEQCGIRFLSIAGTSAGAVTALMLAVLDAPARAKSEQALPVLAGLPMRDFVDGNRRVRRLIDNPPRQDGDWLPQRSLVVDGGILSNFPIDAFHDYFRDEPTRPTFGVKLQLDLRAKDIDGIGDFGYQLFDSARHILDIETIPRNPEFAQLVSFIDTGDHHWLDFDLADEAKLDLFRRGAEEGMAFLRHFDWARYKADRHLLADGLRAMKDGAKQAGVVGAVPEKRYRRVSE